MNDNLSIDKQTKTSRIFNMVLLIFITLTAFGIIALNFSREFYVQISNQIFSAEKPLMDSVILDFFLQRGMSFIIVLILALVAIKEVKITSFKRRLRLNLAAFLCLAAYAVLILFLIYSPVINAS